MDIRPRAAHAPEAPSNGAELIAPYFTRPQGAGLLLRFAKNPGEPGSRPSCTSAIPTEVTPTRHEQLADLHMPVGAKVDVTGASPGHRVRALPRPPSHREIGRLLFSDSLTLTEVHLLTKQEALDLAIDYAKEHGPSLSRFQARAEFMPKDHILNRLFGASDDEWHVVFQAIDEELREIYPTSLLRVGCRTGNIIPMP